MLVTKKIFDRSRRNDGADKGLIALLPGQYQANKNSDVALEILLGNIGPLYLSPFIWWRRMKMGEIII